MVRKRLAIILVLLFLVQGISHPQELLHQGTSPLKPPTKVSLTEPQFSFRQAYAVLCMARLIYELDAVKRYSKNEIKETLTRRYNGALANSSGVQFDLDNIDFGKKGGWTRYYPFSVENRHYIIRLFLTAERSYQPTVVVLFEGPLENPAVTFQVLPGVNAILEGCDIKPYNYNNLRSTPRTASSP